MTVSFAIKQAVQSGRIWFSVLILTFSLLGCHSYEVLRVQDYAKEGVIDLTDWNPSEHKILPLTGEWQFYWKELLSTSRELHKSTNNRVANQPNPSYIKVPGKWNSITKESWGYATFILNIKLPEDPAFQEFITKHPIGIMSKGQRTAAKVIVSKQILFEEGVVAENKKDYQASSGHFHTILPYQGKSIKLIIQIANFEHISGGMTSPIYIGLYEDIFDYIISEQIYKSMLMGILFLAVISNLLIFLFNRKQVLYLIFSSLCFSFLMWELSKNIDMIQNIFPGIHYTQYLKLEYISFFWVIPIGLHFLTLLAVKRVHKIVLYLFYGFAFMFSMGSLIFSIYSISSWIQYTQLMVVAAGIYLIASLIKVRSQSASPMERYVVIASVLLTFGAVLNDILHNRFIINTLLLADSLLLFLVAVHNILLLEEFARSLYQSEKLNLSFRRFVPQQFISLLNKKDIMEVDLGDHINQKMTIFFSDIRNFTALSESMTPAENFEFINSFLTKVSPCIRNHRGFIDKYIGDAIMALFPEKPGDAVQATIDFFTNLKEFNQERQKMKNSPIQVGAGLHTGDLAIGTVGESQRIDTTVISANVNLASRIESLTKTLQSPALITEDTFKLLDNHSKEKFSFRKLSSQKIRGKQNDVLLYELLDCYLDKQDKYLETLELFEEAMSLFRKDDKEASRILKEILKVNPEDGAAKLYLAISSASSKK